MDMHIVTDTFAYIYVYSIYTNVMRLKIIVQMCAFDGARRRAFSLYGATRARRGELCDNLMCFEIIYARESAAINIFAGFRSLWHYGIIYIYIYT